MRNFGQQKKSRFASAKSGCGFYPEFLGQGSIPPPPTPATRKMASDFSARKVVIAAKNEKQGLNHAGNASLALLALTLWSNGIALRETDTQESGKIFFIEQMYDLYSSKAFLEPKSPGYTEITKICSCLCFLRQNELKDDAVNEACSLIEDAIIYFEEGSQKIIKESLAKMRNSLAQEGTVGNLALEKENHGKRFVQSHCRRQSL